MGLLDTSMYQDPPRSLLREGLMGYDNAQKAKGAAMEQRGLMAQQGRQAKTFQQQQEEYTRSQEFNKTLGILAQANDHRTPEGQQAIIRGLGQKGFGAEAMELAQKFPKPAQKTYQSVETDQGMVPFDAQTGIYGSPAQANGQPLRKPVPAAAPKEWNPLDKDRLAEEKRHNMAMEGKSGGSNQKPASVFAQEQQLRTQYLGQTKDFRDVRDAYGRIKTSTKAPTAAGDLSLIYNFMKMQDPGSTVRETEFAAAAASGSYGDRLKAAGEKILSGQRLSSDQRADFLGQAQKLYGAAEFQKKKTQAGYRKMAGQYPGLDAERVLMDDDMAEEAQSPAAAQPTPASPDKIAKAKAYMALPPDSPFRTPAQDAAVKAILGIP